jgi:hypothetical protein
LSRKRSKKKEQFNMPQSAWSPNRERQYEHVRKVFGTAGPATRRRRSRMHKAQLEEVLSR